MLITPLLQAIILFEKTQQLLAKQDTFMTIHSTTFARIIDIFINKIVLIRSDFAAGFSNPVT